MKIFGSMFLTETNTFSPIPTGLSAFRDKLLVSAEDAEDWRERVPIVATWADMAERDGSEFVFGLAAEAAPAGRIVASAYETLRERIFASLAAAGPVDIVLLSLHGAMAAQGCDDCEGDLLQRVRALVGDQTIIGAELDPHCHLTLAMRQTADVLVAYKEYPHVDEVPRAIELYTLCRDAALGVTKPTMAVFDCRMSGLWPTTQEPMRSFVDKLYAAEHQAGILSISLGQGFPWADSSDVGAKLWVVTDNDLDLAQATAERLGRQFHGLRHALAHSYMTIDEAIDAALADRGPAVLADVADNAGGGAPSDSTFILRRLLERTITSAALGCLWDPIAATMAAEAGVGAVLPLRIGGKVSAFSGDPLDVIAQVRGVSQDHWQTSLSGEQAPLGLCVWIETAGIDVVLCSTRDQVFHPDAFERLGLQAMDRRMVVVKSTQHFHAAFAPRASSILYVATPGAIAPDFTSIPYTKRPRPWWPLDENPLEDSASG